jgi:hypothetical protein
MAAADHNPTRRALLGAALGVPLSRHPGLDPRSTYPSGPTSEAAPPPEERWMPDQVRHDDVGAWIEALAAFRTAEAEVAAVQAATAGRSAAEEEALLPAHEDACSKMEAALGRVLRAAAPDLAVLAAKLELLFAHAVEPGAVEEGLAEAVMADARRLGRPRPIRGRSG